MGVKQRVKRDYIFKIYKSMRCESTNSRASVVHSSVGSSVLDRDHPAMKQCTNKQTVKRVMVMDSHTTHAHSHTRPIAPGHLSSDKVALPLMARWEAVWGETAG